LGKIELLRVSGVSNNISRGGARVKLHKVKKRTAEPKNIECRMSKDGIASLTFFLKQTEYINSMFDVRRSLVSFSIRLAAFQARGGARVKPSYAAK
jgi:hypothetical protein